jgi:hypothetical protein
VTALQALHEETAAEPGELVFSTAAGQALDAGTSAGRSAPRGSGGAGHHGNSGTRFASLMSDSDVAVQEIARLVGHASSKVTETVYRH